MASDPRAAIRIVPEFFAGAVELRREFDARTGGERTADPARFVWDYWHVPGQYTYLRAFAARVFPAALYRALSAALRGWGELHLGSSRITEPWLSYFVDGCRQELHTDVPQGPWAFVLSLTHWAERRFSGGETVVLRAEALDYWSQFDPTRALERDALVHRIEPVFNQLLVFDPRIPHGVATVEGTRDPRHARVVLHGWFLPPALTVAGGLPAAQVEAALQPARDAWQADLAAVGPITGALAVRVIVDRAGAPAVELLSDTLISTAHAPDDPRRVVERTVGRLRELRLPAAGEPTRITLGFSADDRSRLPDRSR